MSTATAKDLSPFQRAPYLRWGVLGVLFIATLVAVNYYNLSTKEVYFCGITILALAIWGLELLPEAPVAVVLPVFYILFNVSTPKEVLGNWGSPVGWVMLGGLVLAAMMGKTGLARRVALWAANAVGGSFVKVLWGLLLGGMLLAPFIPSVMGKAAVISVVCIGICESLGLKKGSKECSAVILTGFISVAAPKMAYLTGGGDIILSMKQVSTVANISMTWMDYFKHNFILATIYAIISQITLLVVLRPKIDGDVQASVKKQYQTLGKMKKDEYKVAVIMLVLLAMMLTDTIHKIEIGWLMLTIPFLGFLPGISIMNKETFDKLPFSAVFFVVGCMSIGSAAKSCGIDQTLGKALIPLLQGSEIYSVFMSFASGTALNFLLTPLAAVSAFTTPIVEISNGLGINPFMMVYAFNYGLEQYIFPYEYAVLLFFASLGYTRLSHIIQVFGVRMGVAALYMLLVCYPYWKYIVKL